jgi:hypothetical protein
MITANLAKVDRTTASSVNYLRGTFLRHLIAIADRLDPLQLFRWLQDRVGASEAMQELNLLRDRYLDDVGARRSVDPRADDLVRRLRIGG